MEDEDSILQIIETGDSVKVKQVLDDATLRGVKDMGFELNYNRDNFKLVLMVVSCIFALIAQFYPMPFPDSRILLGVCCSGYFVLSGVLQFMVTFLDDYIILTTYPKKGNEESSFSIFASFAKYQEYYIVKIRNCENQSLATIGKMYVGKYFTERGEFDEIGFITDIQKHVQRYQQKKYQEFEYNHKMD